MGIIQLNRSAKLILLSQITLLLAALLTPFLAWHTVQALAVQSTDPVTWVPQSHPVRRDYDNFTSTFESGDVLIVSWPGCTPTDVRLRKFVEIASTDARFRDPQEGACFERVSSGAALVAGLAAPPLELTHDEIRQRLKGVVLGPQDETVAVLTFTKFGAQIRAEVVRLVKSVLEEECQVPDVDQHLAGPIMDGHDVDAASNGAMNVFAPLATAAIFLMCWWCLKSLRIAAMVFGVAGFCEIATLALVRLCGDMLNPLMIVMPPLLLVLGVSGGIHLANYYFDALRTGEAHAAPQRALRTGWMPCLLSSGTTAIGLASLLVSDLKPIRDFGLYSAIGTMLTLIVLFAFLPGAFALWPADRVKDSESDDSPNLAPIRPHSAIAAWLARHHVLVTVVSFAAMLVTGWKVKDLETSVRIQTLFAPESRILRDYAWIEEHVGPLVPIEVLIHIREPSTLSVPERLSLVRNIHARLRELSEVKATLSAATFEPPLPDFDIPAPLMQRMMHEVGQRLVQSLEAFELVKGDDKVQIWRVTARVSALENIDYGSFLGVVRKHIGPVLKGTNSQDIDVTLTGAMPVVHEIQRELLRDLFNSFVSAFVLITVVMIWNERGVAAGLISMIPNVFPMVLMFGLLGWLQQPMDLGSVMTASLALGMAIDGTLHYLTFFRAGLAQNMSRPEAVEYAFSHCAPAMTESSVSCAAGLMMFVFSTFLPTNRFAWMIAALTAAALAGDLIVLPALLAGPFGRFFETRRRTQS